MSGHCISRGNKIINQLLVGKTFRYFSGHQNNTSLKFLQPCGTSIFTRERKTLVKCRQPLEFYDQTWKEYCKRRKEWENYIKVVLYKSFGLL